MALNKAELISRAQDVDNLETPAHLFDSWITPVALFFVRNHLPLPHVDLALWRLAVTGEVARPMILSFDDIRRLEHTSVTNTLECAGNGRAFFQPSAPGVAWARGAVGNALFSGPRLATVLARAGLKASANHVAFRGLEPATNDIPDFVRSIPIEKALHPDTLLATEMNGAPLTIEHGFPVRSLVPGWVGAVSVKWLTEIRVLDDEFDGYFMTPHYRFPTRPIAPNEELDPADTAAITALPVKSIITQPADGWSAVQQPIRIAGAAWAGESQITRVDVSTDGGHTWREAKLQPERAKYAWRLWEHVWNPGSAGEFTLMSRATDDAGHTQPLTCQWNPQGYLWNAIDRIMVRVTA